MTTSTDAPDAPDAPAPDTPAPDAAAPAAPATALLARLGLAPAPEELARIETLRAEAEQQAALVHAVPALRYVEPGLVWSAQPVTPEGAVA